MKHIIILGDGMADWPVESLGNKTLLQYARTPYMDLIASNGINGRLKTVPEGFHPGSEVANSAILGYDQHIVYQGRGPLEAASIGIELGPDDAAYRCNIIALEDGKIKNHHGDNLSTEEGTRLIKLLDKELGTERIHFYPGIQYRHLMVIKGGNAKVKCTPPHDVPGTDWKTVLPEDEELTQLILRSQEVLSRPEARREGKTSQLSIWPWAGGHKPQMEPLTITYPQIKSGAVITAVDLIRGIGHYAGLRCIDVEGATGLSNTNYEGKAQAAIKALKTDDFVYVHVEAADEAGHDGDLNLKIKCIEDLDSRLIKPIYQYVESLSTADQPVSIAVLPDHPTPVAHRTHTNEPIPFAIWHKGITPDTVQTFDEEACKQGALGLLEGDEFIKTFMSK